MLRYKLTIEYDGAGLCGWQRQEGQPSVQAHLESAVAKFCGERAEVVGAGRTDAGVHALAQVAHMDLQKEQDPLTVQNALNFHLLPERIAVLKAEIVPPDFHARFSAKGRHYLYRIINRRPRLALDAGRTWHIAEPLDGKAMHAAAQLLLGKHDFTSFRDSQCQAQSPIKTLDKLDVERMGDEIRIHASARSFLHHQVRNMVGTLRLVGNGKWMPEDIARALAVQDRRAAGPTAPAEGLYLARVDY